MLDLPDTFRIFDRAIAEHSEMVRELPSLQPQLEMIAARLAEAILKARKILWCGNGGSAADAQHLAAELVGRFRKERRALASIALTTNTSVLTAIGNDYGYEHVFRRQVEAFCQPGDVVVGISTSGNSANVCIALRTARDLGAYTVALTGLGGGAVARSADIALCIPSKDTARIQEAHILCGHMLCDWIEQSICAHEPAEVEAVSR